MGYMVAGYLVVLGGLLSYALWVRMRTRALERLAPRREEHR